jgi:hypothetical protein
MIDWISVDDVLYQWNGQEIVCETGVGYSTNLDDHQLDGLEITDSAGNVAGQLFVDFAAGTIAYEPFDETHSDGSILYSLNGQEIAVALSQLPEIVTLHDVITIENEDVDLWSSIANVSQASADNIENIASLIHLDHQSVLDAGDSTLDLVLQNINGAMPVVAEQTNSTALYDFNGLPAATSVVDPLDSLHFYNAG